MSTSSGRIRVAVTGATGRTGNAVAHGLAGRDDVVLVACVSPSAPTHPRRPLPHDVPAVATLPELRGSYDVLVDFTHADAAVANVRSALGAGKHVVLGTTGIAWEVLEELGHAFAERDLGLLYCPNFAIGAVLMMRFAAEAGKHLHDVEIVETHHAGKRDAPSGTARRTAELVAAARAQAGGAPSAPASSDPARGEQVDGVPVHSLRLSGAVAHQEIVFSGPGELLTIGHDALDRGSYTAGVALAVRRVASLSGLTIGLEHVL